MTIPMLPGFWDEIKDSTVPFMQAIMERAMPDNFAERRLQQLVQRDPTLLPFIQNMDDLAREKIAEAIGFKKKNPFKDLPAGPEREKRERIAEAWKNASPEVRARGMATEAGLPVQEDIDWLKGSRARQKEKEDLDIERDRITTQVMKEGRARIEEALQQTGGKVDLTRILKDIISLNISPATATEMQILNTIPGAMETLNNMITIYRVNEELKANKEIANMRVSNQTGSDVRALLSNSRQAYMSALAALSKLMDPKMMTIPSFADRIRSSPEYLQAVENVKNAKKAYENIYNTMARPLGIEDAPLPEAPTDLDQMETFEERYNRMFGNKTSSKDDMEKKYKMYRGGKR
jgi:hypothetical protein